MYNTHTTSDGVEMLIASMDNNHLLNTIKIHAKRIHSARHSLQGGAVEDPLIQIFQPEYCRAAMERRAKSAIISAHTDLYDYVMEASLRGLDVTQILQTAYGRSEAIATPHPSFDDTYTAEAVAVFEAGVQEVSTRH